MKKTFLILVGLVFAASVWAVAAPAATVHLNSGTAISGKVVESTADNIKVDVEGVTVTYYKDEVASIEGDEAAAKVLGVAVIAPAAPAEEVPAAVPAEAPLKVREDVKPAPVEPVAPDQEVAPTLPVAAPSAGLSSDKKEKVLKFIDVFGTRETMKMNFDQILASMPPQDAEKLKGAFNIDDVIQELVPLYDKHFTSEDLDGFIQFYSSSTGRKLVQTIPLIMQESVDVSAKYFEEHLPVDMKEETATPGK